LGFDYLQTLAMCMHPTLFPVTRPYDWPRM